MLAGCWDSSQTNPTCSIYFFRSQNGQLSPKFNFPLKSYNFPLMILGQVRFHISEVRFHIFSPS